MSFDCYFRLDNIIRYMRQRRARRRGEEPTTSRTGETPIARDAPSRIPITSRRIATRSISMQANSSSAESISIPSPPTHISHSPRRIQEPSPFVTRRRRDADNFSAPQNSLSSRQSPDHPNVTIRSYNDIHRVARSRTFSDLLDNPRGPRTRYRGNHEAVMEYVDLANEVPVIPVTDESSSDSSWSLNDSYNSVLSVPEPPSESSSDFDDDPQSPVRSSSSSSSSEHEE
jgi:hypothetical protein